MTHDPLCGTAPVRIGNREGDIVFGCTCEQIALARADERNALIRRGETYWRNLAELELRKLEAEVLPGCLAPDECHCGRCPRVGDSV